MATTVDHYYNCYILKQGKIIFNDLFVKCGKFVNPADLTKNKEAVPFNKINCEGLLISPGFIDLQVNGGFNIDFSRLTDVDLELKKFSNRVLAYGVTSFCPTIISSNSKYYKYVLPKFNSLKQNKGGANIIGVHLEGPFINPAKKGAHPVDLIQSSENGFSKVKQVYGSLENVVMVTLAPELENIGSIIKQLVSLDIKVSIGHTLASLDISKKAVKNGATCITHLFNAMTPFNHREPGVIGLLTNDDVSKQTFFGVIADGIHVHPSALKIAYKANPKGIILVTDGMTAVGLPDGNYHLGENQVCKKGIKVTVNGTDTLAGSAATLDFCVKQFRLYTGCELSKCLECATLHPAQCLGVDKFKGSLDFGYDADFVVLNDRLDVLKTYVSGKKVFDLLIRSNNFN